MKKSVRILYFILAIWCITAFCFAKEVKILTFNNFLGAVEHNDSNFSQDPGITNFMNFVQKERDSSSILLSSGNNYEGTYISVLTQGALVSDMFKALNLSASAIGNHDFDWGQKNFSIWEKQGGFPFLCANMFYKNSLKRPDFAKPYIVETINGIKIGIIGLTSKAILTATSSSNVTNITIKNPAHYAKQYIDYLHSGKAPEGKVDAIILLTHISATKNSYGFLNEQEMIDLAKLKGVSAIIASMPIQDTAYKTPIIQGGFFGQSLGQIILTFNDKKQVTAVKTNILKTPILSVKPNAIVNKYHKVFESSEKKIGTLDQNISRNPDNNSLLGILICKAINASAKTDIAFLNSGGIRNDLYKGPVTIGDIYDVMPFDNTIYTLSITGQDIYNLIRHGYHEGNIGGTQFYGIKVYYYPDRQALKQITLLNGAPLKLQKRYTVAINDFMATGGDGYKFTGAKNRHDTKVKVRDAMIAYIKEKQHVNMPIDTFTYPISKAE